MGWEDLKMWQKGAITILALVGLLVFWVSGTFFVDTTLDKLQHRIINRKQSYDIMSVTMPENNMIEIKLEIWSRKFDTNVDFWIFSKYESLSLWVNDKKVDIDQYRRYNNYDIGWREDSWHPHTEVPFTQTGHYLTLWLDFGNLTISHPIKVDLKKDDKIVDSYIYY